jgi:diguanylate cyclase (GGDEF)-like protein
MNWKNILRSGHRFTEDETQLKLRFVLLNLLLLTNIAFSIILMILRYVEGNYRALVLDLAYLFFSLMIFVIARRTKEHFDLLIINVLVVAYIFTVIIYDQMFNPIAGISWFILLTLVAVIFRGRKTAIVFAILSAVAILWVSIVRHGISVEEALTGLIPFVSGLLIVLIFDALQANMRKTIEAQKDKYIQLSRRDALINIPNRAYFLDYFSQVLERIREDESAPGFALLFVDVDRFKSINDRFGHPVGDTVLLEVGKRLKSRLRRDDMVARYGGDEFAVIVSKIDSPLALRRMLDRLMTDMNRPFVVGDWRIDVALSIGVVMIPQDGLDEVELLKEADQAMYAAKKERGNSYRFYQDISGSQTIEHRGGHWAAWKES